MVLVLKKNGQQAIGKTRGGKNTKIHMIVANAKTPVVYSLSRGNLNDAPQGRELLEKLDGKPFRKAQQGKRSRMLMDKAYEGGLTRKTVRQQGFVPVVPAKVNRKKKCPLDEELYKRRNEVERYFRRIKAYRRIFTRYDKLDIMYNAFIQIAMINEFLRNVV